MKALTIRQPWASLVMSGVKQFETRSWSTSYRGLLAIHAGKRWTKHEMEEYLMLEMHIPAGAIEYEFPLGTVLGTVMLIDIFKIEDILPSLSDAERAFGDYSPGRYAWKLEAACMFETPIPAKGKLGLWELEWETVVAVNPQFRQKVPTP